MKFLAMLVAAVLVTGCTVVGPGERGIRISLGSVSADPKPSGVYLWIPFLMGMASVDVQIQKSEIESTGATKDMQDVHAKVAVNWALNGDNVVTTYSTIGDESDVLLRILEPAVNEVMKSVTAKRTAEEVLTKRMEMKVDIDAGLQERLKQYGIKLYDVNIVNLAFSDEFTNAIEAKQIAEQAAKQASYVAQKATQDALATVELAKGQAEAQKLLRSSLTKEILQQRAIEKWDGKFPQVMGGTGALPFVNIKGE